MASPVLDYKPHIDGLRALAVLLVVLFHGFPTDIPGGFIGVDIFFVLSGYLITQLLLVETASGTFSYRGFLMRRVRRLAPSFLLVASVSMLLAWKGIFAPDLIENAKSLASSLLLSSNWYFYFNSDYFSPDLNSNLFLHHWSLSIEEQFYLIYPLVLFALRKNTKLLKLVLLGGWLLSFGWAVWDTSHAAKTQLFFASHTRAWELLTGCLLAVWRLPLLGHALLQSLQDSRKGSLLLATLGNGALLVTLIFAFVLTKDHPIPGFALLPLVLVICLPLLLGELTMHPKRSLLSRVLENRSAVYLGKISYAFYLWHWPLLVMLRQIYSSTEDWQVFIVIVIAGLLASTTYHFLENPLRTRRLLPATLPLLASCGAVWALLLFTSSQIFTHGGYPGRIPERAYLALDGIEDKKAPDQRCMKAAKAKLLNNIGALLADPTFVGQRVCFIGAQTNEIDFVLWGDSHAAAIATPIAEKAVALGLTGISFTKAACPPLGGVASRVHDKKNKIACTTRNEFIMQVIEQQQIPVTLMVGHWDVYVSLKGGTKSGILVAANSSTQKTVNSFPVTQDTRLLFENATTKTITRLAPFTEIHYLLDVPTHDLPVPQAIAQTKIWPWLPTPDWITRAQHEAARSKYQPFIMALEKAGLLIVFEPMDMLCIEKICLSEKNGKPLFFDNSHLSYTGASYLVDNMEGLLEPQ